jgi:hypothetical protein
MARSLNRRELPMRPAAPLPLPACYLVSNEVGAEAGTGRPHDPIYTESFYPLVLARSQQMTGAGRFRDRPVR